MAELEREQWRRLAETVPGAFLRIACGVTVAGRLLASTRAKLAACVPVLAALAVDKPAPAGGVPRGRLPSADLKAALRELARLYVAHAVVCDIHIRADARLNGHIVLYPRMLPRWRVCHDVALSHAEDLRRRLRAAAAQARAFECAVRRAVTFPRGSPDWRSSVSAAEKLASHAAVTVGLAFYAARQMRNAISLEFFEAWVSLHLDTDTAREVLRSMN